MNSLFLQAAASYYGLANANIQKAEWYSDGNGTVAVFELRIADDDMLAVLDRMKVLKDEHMRKEAHSEARAALPEIPEPTREELRAAYNAMSTHERGAYGSFARYVALSGGSRSVQHVETPEVDNEIKSYWVDGADTDAAQRAHASQVDGDRYLLTEFMLNDAQREKYS